MRSETHHSSRQESGDSELVFAVVVLLEKICENTKDVKQNQHADARFPSKDEKPPWTHGRTELWLSRRCRNSDGRVRKDEEREWESERGRATRVVEGKSDGREERATHMRKKKKQTHGRKKKQE